MSEEGYLQTKIKELTTRVNDLDEEVISLKQQRKKVIDDVASEITQQVRKQLAQFDKVVVEEVKSAFNTEFRERMQESYMKLHSRISEEMKISKISMKEVAGRFITECALQRKDLSIINSVLLEKNIVTEEELRMLNKRIQLKENEIVDELKSQFNPVITKIKG